MSRGLRLAGAVGFLLCGLASFYLAVTHLDLAGGRSGLLVVGVVFLLFAAMLARRGPRG